jgi:two-component sensor histidine kinase
MTHEVAFAMETPSPGHRRSRRALTPRRALIAVALLVVAFGTAAWSLHLWSDYRTTLAAAHDRGEAALDALGEHTRRLVVTNDLLLQQMMHLLQQDGVDLYRTRESAWRTVRDLAELPQQSVTISVIDDTGRMLVSSRAFGSVSSEQFADRPYFETHRQGNHDGLLIGPTLFSRIDGSPYLVFSRRWEWPDGSFRGVIASAVRADHFLDFAEKLSFGPKSTLSIVRGDGLVLIRRPLTPEVVQLDLDDYELFTDHLPRSAEGYYDAVSPADGERRVVLYRALHDLPLIMVAGLANDDIFGRWQWRTLQTALLVAFAFAAIGAVTAIGMRHAGREALALAQLQAAREHERLLVAEVDHRARNLLSIIEAQIRQTARHSGSKHDLVQKLSGRIQALASAHDLLSAEKWKEVDVRTLVEREILPFSGEEQAAVHGESIRVEPKLAMSLAVVLHELATNAAKYGAWSAPEGRVDISWARIEQPQPALRLTWTESGGPPVTPPSRKGFGTILIERSLPHELGGSVSLEFLPDGVQALFVIPLAPPVATSEASDPMRPPAHDLHPA